MCNILSSFFIYLQRWSFNVEYAVYHSNPSHFLEKSIASINHLTVYNVHSNIRQIRIDSFYKRLRGKRVLQMQLFSECSLLDYQGLSVFCWCDLLNKSFLFYFFSSIVSFYKESILQVTKLIIKCFLRWGLNDMFLWIVMYK